MNEDLLNNKEKIKKRIRTALSENKSNATYPSFDSSISCISLSNNETLFDAFIRNFRAAGGLFIRITKEELQSNLVQLLNAQKFKNVLSLYKPEELLEHNQEVSSTIHKFMPQSLNETPIDAVIFYSHILIALNGGIVCSHTWSHYPTIKDISSNLIVIAQESHIVPDFKSAIQICEAFEEKKNLPWDSLEILSPTPKPSTGYSRINPRIILFLIKDS